MIGNRRRHDEFFVHFDEMSIVFSNGFSECILPSEIIPISGEVDFEP
jgi:hypothetical protein